MSRYGHCKNCWWWNQIAKDKGICWFQTYYDDNPSYSGIDEYCPDYRNRRVGNKFDGVTLKQWLEEGGHKYITYKKLY